MVAAGRLGTVVKLAWKKAGKLTSLGASRRGTRGAARARLKEKVKEKGLVNKNLKTVEMRLIDNLFYM